MIVLSTLNSTYQHAAFGLRYLKANMQELQEHTEILEFTIKADPRDIAEAILKKSPRIVGIGVYIWNADQSLQVVSILKKVAPEIIVVIGGPEVSHESENQEIVRLADCLIVGEADFEFYKFCRKILDGDLNFAKIIRGPLPEILKIELPYRLFTDEDIKNRVLYVEASRGCPYKCEYCLSSLDKSVRSFALDAFLNELDLLIKRGARSFKFVDRTFNLSPTTSLAILNFFLERMHHGLFLHFEMVPDRLPAELRALIQKFPDGALQFEVGIQTWNQEVAKLVSRRNDFVKVRENLRFLNSQTGVHVHADLIAGLPGETIESFAEGFDELYQLKPDEIQVGVLKRLKGAPIARHDVEWKMVYQTSQPFQILQTKTMPYQEIQFMSRFSKFWDAYANSGQFKEMMLLFEELGKTQFNGSFFYAFADFVKFISKTQNLQIHFSLESLAEKIWRYFVYEKELPREMVEAKLIQDYCYRVKRRDLPTFLKNINRQENPVQKNSLQRRQQNHQAHLV